MAALPQRELPELGNRPALGGIGLGLRWEFLEEVLDGPAQDVAFFEVSPENYLGRGGYYPSALERIAERYPIVTHGLTLSLGAIAEPDPRYLNALRAELTRLNPPWHSDHLCFSSAGERVLHELLPLKFSEENVHRVAERARRVEAFLERPLAIENITYYVHPGEPEMSELAFLQRVLEQSQARLLLDVNNVYVNAKNHGFDPYAFIAALPLERVRGDPRRGPPHASKTACCSTPTGKRSPTQCSNCSNGRWNGRDLCPCCWSVTTTCRSSANYCGRSHNCGS